MSELIQWSIQPLARDHERGDFDCGKAQLNDFLKKYAGQNQDRNISRTYVAVPPQTHKVEGFYSISAGSVKFNDLPEEKRKKLPMYPVPVAHIGRLAVDKAVHGRGLGRLLLMDAMERIVKVSAQLGIHAVEVFAKDEQARRFYLKYGFVPLLDDSFHLYLNIATIEKLFVS